MKAAVEKRTKKLEKNKAKQAAQAFPPAHTQAGHTRGFSSVPGERGSGAENQGEAFTRSHGAGENYGLVPPAENFPRASQIYGDFDDGTYPIEPIEIPVDDVQSSDEDLEINYTKTNVDGKTTQDGQGTDLRGRNPGTSIIVEPVIQRVSQKENGTKIDYGSDKEVKSKHGEEESISEEDVDEEVSFDD